MLEPFTARTVRVRGVLRFVPPGVLARLRGVPPLRARLRASLANACTSSSLRIELYPVIPHWRASLAKSRTVRAFSSVTVVKNSPPTNGRSQPGATRHRDSLRVMRSGLGIPWPSPTSEDFAPPVGPAKRARGVRRRGRMVCGDHSQRPCASFACSLRKPRSLAVSSSRRLLRPTPAGLQSPDRLFPM